MHAEEANQEKARQGMSLMNIFTGMMENAILAVGSRKKDVKDEEEDNQISIGADSNDRKPAPTSEEPRIKADQFEDDITTWPTLGMIAPDRTYTYLKVYYA